MKGFVDLQQSGDIINGSRLRKRPLDLILCVHAMSMSGDEHVVQLLLRGKGRASRQLAFFVDATKCINCRTCEIACKDFNNSAVGQRIRKVRVFEGGEFPKVYAYSISMSCNHCEEPICAKHCPAGAYRKRAADGIVIHDPERCIGCRYCTWPCPYGAPQYDPHAGCVHKCNLCVQELDKGNSPVCVASCPMRAIEIGPLDEIAGRTGAVIAIRNLPSPELTKPASRYKVRPEAKSA